MQQCESFVSVLRPAAPPLHPDPEVTITHHDRIPEMLAAVRRGPFAAPTEFEKVEFLFTRVKKGQSAVRFDRYGLEHALSYQRRVHAIKVHFLKRYHDTPLGEVIDYWDRTESQQRGSLHAHILVWLKRVRAPTGWKALEPIPKTTAAAGPKQRPRDQIVHDLKGVEYQEDSLYQLARAGRVSAEMVRPDISGLAWGGYDCHRLRIAGLARSIQYRVPYLHSCSPSYCMKDRSSCRFFFPCQP